MIEKIYQAAEEAGLIVESVTISVEGEEGEYRCKIEAELIRPPEACFDNHSEATICILLTDLTLGGVVNACIETIQSFKKRKPQ